MSKRRCTRARHSAKVRSRLMSAAGKCRTNLLAWEGECQRGGRAAAQARAAPGHQRPVNCRQGQAGNGNARKEGQRPLPVPQQNPQHLGGWPVGQQAAGCINVLIVESLLQRQPA